MMKCPYCGGVARKQPCEKVYSTVYHSNYGDIWVCDNYPECDAYVGCKPSGKPLGTLANSELRGMRVKTHNLFDKIWKKKLMNRSHAYRWMAEEMGLTAKQAHIGKFNIEQCEKLQELVKEKFKLSNEVLIKCEIVRKTDKAILVRDKQENEAWLPKSQIKHIFEDGDYAEVTIPTWLSEDKGLWEE